MSGNSDSKPVSSGRKKPFPFWILLFIMLFTALGALVSGPMLFLAPDGHLMQWSPAMLAGTPFPNFLIPGIILFLCIGVFPVVVSLSLLRVPRWQWVVRLNPTKRYHWALAAAGGSGIVTLVWIAVETAMLGYISFLQPLIAAFGIAVIALTLSPAIRRYYAVPA